MLNHFLYGHTISILDLMIDEGFKPYTQIVTKLFHQLDSEIVIDTPYGQQKGLVGDFGQLSHDGNYLSFVAQELFEETYETLVINNDESRIARKKRHVYAKYIEGDFEIKTKESLNSEILSNMVVCVNFPEEVGDWYVMSNDEFIKLYGVDLKND